jgi:hypothetical protein
MDCAALVTIEQPALPAELIEPLRLAADFARASKAPATQEAYGIKPADSHAGGHSSLSGRRGQRWQAREHAGEAAGRHPLLSPRCRPRHADRR